MKENTVWTELDKEMKWRGTNEPCFLFVSLRSIRSTFFISYLGLTVHWFISFLFTLFISLYIFTKNAWKMWRKWNEVRTKSVVVSLVFWLCFLLIGSFRASITFHCKRTINKTTSPVNNRNKTWNGMRVLSLCSIHLQWMKRSVKWIDQRKHAWKEPCELIKRKKHALVSSLVFFV